MPEDNFLQVKSEITRRMQGAYDVLVKDFIGLRTGRASINLLDSITVDAYGSELPMSQVGTIGAPEPRLLTVQVWDKGLVKAVEKSIQDSGLGLNAQSDGQLVRVPIPSLTEERRLELSKVASKYSEEARVSVRNVRRHFMDELKKDEKNGKISSDLHRDQSQEIQLLTDDFIKKIDETLRVKEKEIIQV